LKYFLQNLCQGFDRKVKHTANNLGKVRLDFGGTVCKVSMAIDYIENRPTKGRGVKG
jgi:hypothetical protein